jgi:hypothetical protein
VREKKGIKRRNVTNVEVEKEEAERQIIEGMNMIEVHYVKYMQWNYITH